MTSILKENSKRLIAKYPKIFFCHVPKCAGIALSDALFASLYPSFIKFTKCYKYIHLNGSRVAGELLGVDMMLCREAQLIDMLSSPHSMYVTGHCIARPGLVERFDSEWDFVTLLRKPVSRFVSNYVYDRYKQNDWNRIELEPMDYLQTPEALASLHTYARYFSGMSLQEIQQQPDLAVERSVANLARFRVCGVLENLPDWMDKFEQVYDKRPKLAEKNKSPNNAAYAQLLDDERVMAKITELSRVDQHIYDEIASR